MLGGLLVTDLSWRWVFYVNVPLGIAGVVFGALFLHEQRHDDPGDFDFGGFILAGVGFGAVMYAASEGPSKGWTAPAIVGAGVVGLVVLAVLAIIELRVRKPLLDLRLLANGLFRSATGSSR